MLIWWRRMTGINTVMLYSAKIFHFAGVTDPFLATTIVGAVNVGVTVISVKLVDSHGRRPLLLLGTVVMIVALAVLSWSLLYLNSNLKTQGAIAVVSVLFFVGGFAVGLGAVVWYVCCFDHACCPVWICLMFTPCWCCSTTGSFLETSRRCKSEPAHSRSTWA